MHNWSGLILIGLLFCFVLNGMMTSFVIGFIIKKIFNMGYTVLLRFIVVIIFIIVFCTYGLLLYSMYLKDIDVHVFLGTLIIPSVFYLLAIAVYKIYQFIKNG